MNSNLHNVLFVPEDGVLYIANADHKSPAADRPYVKLDLNELLKTMPVRLAAEKEKKKQVHIKPKIAIDAQFAAIDTLNLREESRDDAKQCLDGLKWIPSDFAVRIEAAQENCGDMLVRFPSARPSANAANDSVAMEWYQAKDKDRNPINAPGAVIVHESGSGMTVGRIVARSLRSKGIHNLYDAVTILRRASRGRRPSKWREACRGIATRDR